MLVKNKQSMTERASRALRLDMNRKKPLSNEDRASLEKKLINLDHYYDASHVGKNPLSDAMLIERACSQQFIRLSNVFNVLKADETCDVYTQSALRETMGIFLTSTYSTTPTNGS
jgi:hypothetical protein